MNFNLVDPPYLNTVIVPINGWAAIRFEAVNPGMWHGIPAYINLTSFVSTIYGSFII